MASMTATQGRAKTKATPEMIAALLDQEPVVGVTKGSEILGIKPSNFRRDAVPYLIEVKIEGSASAYFRSQVEQLAADRDAKRNATDSQ